MAFFLSEQGIFLKSAFPFPRTAIFARLEGNSRWIGLGGDLKFPPAEPALLFIEVPDNHNN